MEQQNNILEIRDLTVHYVLEEETVQAVNGISLTLGRGRVDRKSVV